MGSNPRTHNCIARFLFPFKLPSSSLTPDRRLGIIVQDPEIMDVKGKCLDVAAPMDAAVGCRLAGSTAPVPHERHMWGPVGRSLLPYRTCKTRATSGLSKELALAPGNRHLSASTNPGQRPCSHLACSNLIGCRFQFCCAS